MNLWAVLCSVTVAARNTASSVKRSTRRRLAVSKKRKITTSTLPVPPERGRPRSAPAGLPSTPIWETSGTTMQSPSATHIHTWWIQWLWRDQVFNPSNQHTCTRGGYNDCEGIRYSIHPINMCNTQETGGYIIYSQRIRSIKSTSATHREVVDTIQDSQHIKYSISWPMSKTHTIFNVWNTWRRE